MNVDQMIEALTWGKRAVRDDVQVWLDVANKLPTYEEVKEHLNPALKARTLEWVKEWEKQNDPK